MNLEDIFLAKPELRELLAQSLSARDAMLTKLSAIDLWLYHVESKTFFVTYQDGKGHVQHNSHPISVNDSYKDIDPNDTEEMRKHPLDTESEKRWHLLLHNLGIDTSLPEEGYIDLNYRDHSRRIRSYYCVVKDDQGKPLCVVGESEDISKTRAYMQHVIDEQNEYIRVINGFKLSFESIVYIDLNDHSFKIIEGSKEVRDAASQYTNAQELVEEVIAKTMHPKYQDAFRKLADLHDIRSMLKDRKYVSFEYESQYLGWLKMRVMPAEYDAMGNITHIIISTESVAEEHREKDQLKKLSEHDGLTGLFNRAAGVSRIESLLKTESGILVLFDCDKFKSINDTFGHLVGDKVLVEVANCLQQVFEGQVLFRLGGDEFVCYLRQSFLEQKKADGFTESGIFEELQRQLDQINIPEMNGQTPSISGGAARSVVEKPIIFDELYKLADLALYQSKKYGRKKVTMMNLTFGQLGEQA